MTTVSPTGLYNDTFKDMQGCSGYLIQDGYQELGNLYIEMTNAGRFYT